MFEWKQVRYVVITAVVGFANLAFGDVTEDSKQPNPSTTIRNVLFLSIDDLNDWTGFMGGNDQSQTPFLDQFSKESFVFLNAHCPAPSCNPSRAAVMTGILPSKSGVYTNRQYWRTSPVLKDAITLPQAFKQKGFLTIGTGKLFHWHSVDPQSWNSYWPPNSMGRPGDPDRRVIEKSNDKDGPMSVRVEQMGDWQVSEVARKFLRGQQQRPFFLGCGIWKPHKPWAVPGQYFSRYPLQDIELPPLTSDDVFDRLPKPAQRLARPERFKKLEEQGPDRLRKEVRGYLASTQFADEMAGRVLAALREGPNWENTIVVVWSDHGYHLGEKKHFSKHTLWEESTRSLLMIRVPGLTKGGEHCKAPVNLVDIYPTLMELFGREVPEVLDGRSLVPLLKDPGLDWNTPSLTTFDQNNHTVRTLHWRYTRYEDGGEELYDHRVDPAENRNLAEDERHAEKKRELARALPTKAALPIPDTH